MIIVSKEEGAKWPNLGSLTELRGFYGNLFDPRRGKNALCYGQVGLNLCLP